MPHGPPKTWWHGCVHSVASHGGAVDPRRVCGAVWSHKSSAEKKGLTIMAERKRKKTGKKRTARGRPTARHKRHRVTKRLTTKRQRRRTSARVSGAPRKHSTTTRAAAKKRARPTAISGALPLIGDTSFAGRRRLRLAKKIGLKVR